MSDVALKLKEDSSFDIEIANGDLVADEGLETAVAISLFTDRRVTDEQLPQGITEKRGWWGDMFADNDGDQIGSRLWTLQREKKTQELLRLAEDYAREALQWLIEDGVASSIGATAQFTGEAQSRTWEIVVSITRPSGRTSRFEVVWTKQSLKRVA